MGEGINEATLVKWLKKPGDTVEEDEPLVEVSTDKVDTEIPSPFTGTIKEILAEPDTQISVHSAIARIETKEAPVKKAPVKTKEKSNNTQASLTKNKPSKIKSPRKRRAPVTDSSKTPTVNAETVRSSPIVRRMAAEYDIDLGSIKGTGLAGRITKSDIEKYLNHGPSFEQPSLDGSNPLFHLETESKEDGEYLDSVLVERKPMSKMRTLIAEHMNRSIRVSPHVTTTFDVMMDGVVAHRKASNESYIKKHEFKLTYTHYIVHAAIETIKEFPIVNVSVDGDDILWKKDINIGVAVAIENGLIVPVLKSTQNLDLIGIGKGVNDLASRARSKKLTPADVQGGTFSITNPGLYGSITSNPIINQPQVAILGVGAIQKVPVVIDDKIGIGHKMMVSLTFDHRVIDGETGAKFLKRYKEILENSWN